MIKLHHLNQSRSKRIIWLLEELNVDYEIVPYVRDKVTFMAPPELKSVHPLGKSPLLEDDGEFIIESGAMTEYLIEKYSDEIRQRCFFFKFWLTHKQFKTQVYILFCISFE